MSDRVTEIRVRLDAATPGPWYRYSRDFRDSRSHSVKTAPGSVVAFMGYGPEGGTTYLNAELFANAPADLAYLLDVNATLRARLAAVEELAANYRARADHWPEPRAQWSDIERDIRAALNQEGKQ